MAHHLSNQIFTFRGNPARPCHLFPIELHNGGEKPEDKGLLIFPTEGPVDFEQLGIKTTFDPF